MEVRPYLTAGAAIVTTGALVVATPALVPAPTPPDVRISAAAPESVYADVALRFTSQELFNAIFSGYPDTNGPSGLVGVALLLSDDAFGEDSPASAFISGGIVGLARAFFPDDTVAAAFLDGGIVGVASLLTDGVPLINSFFAGGPNDTPGGIVGVADELTDGVPSVNSFVTGGIVGVADELTVGVPLVNSFVTGGIVGVADELTTGNELANTFVNGGFVPATELVLVNATAGNPVVSEGIQSFFSGYPFGSPRTRSTRTLRTMKPLMLCPPVRQESSGWSTTSSIGSPATRAATGGGARRDGRRIALGNDPDPQRHRGRGRPAGQLVAGDCQRSTPAIAVESDLGSQ